jgi:hypothetical protein
MSSNDLWPSYSWSSDGALINVTQHGVQKVCHLSETLKSYKIVPRLSFVIDFRISVTTRLINGRAVLSSCATPTPRLPFVLACLFVCLFVDASCCSARQN